MKTILISLILLVIIVRQDQKQIDTENSTVEFIFTDKNVNGTIGDIQSQSTLNWEEPEKSVLKGSVAVTTLKTRNFLRDGHLMWEKYFNRGHNSKGHNPAEVTKEPFKTLILKGFSIFKGIIWGLILYT